MIIVESIAELRAALAPGRRAGRRLGLVATMGAFHEGHLSLMRHAVAACDEVVVSLFVNPTQFNEAGDLADYPRDERADAQQADALGVDWLFAPPVREMYPDGFATTISVAGVSEPLEGVHRGTGHFQGVATVVCKLLNIVGPDVAYFGAKDAQQLAVIRTDGLGPRHARRDRGAADRARRTTVWRCRVATRCCPPPIADARPPCSGRWPPSPPPSPPASVTLSGRSRPVARSCATAASSSNTCNSSIPRRCGSCRNLTAMRSR